MYHRDYRQAQRPVGRPSWPAALCTSSLLHIWTYLRNTTNHYNRYTSQKPMIQPTAQLFSYAAQLWNRPLKSQRRMLNLTDDEEWKQNVWRVRKEIFQDISAAADTRVAGNRTNSTGLIRNRSGKPPQRLMVKPLLSEAARAATVGHSRHLRKGLMHKENLTLPQCLRVRPSVLLSLDISQLSLNCHYWSKLEINNEVSNGIFSIYSPMNGKWFSMGLPL